MSDACAWLYSFLFSLSLSLSLSACGNLATLRPEPRHIIGFKETHHISDQTITILAASNSEKLKLYHKELEYRKGSPKYCLSLSGGGVRSAWYSIGVMKALAKAKKLDSLDIISATSGGSYALGWYYSNMVREIDNKSIPEAGVGRDAGLFDGQAYVDLHKAYEHEYGTIFPFLRNFLDGVSAIFSVALSPLSSLYFGPPQDSSGRMDYRERIEKTFLGAPLDRHSIHSASSKLKEVGDKVVKYQLPIFIIAATAQGDNTDHVPLSNAVFEYTPFSKGSDGTGYTEVDADTTIGDAIATAGAAIDLPLKSPIGSHARAYTGLTVGHPEDQYGEHQLVQSYYYLSDGGHSDNLALVPLIRRHCENIIVVDAEEDSEFEFSSYASLKEKLLTEYETKISIPIIDENLAKIGSVGNNGQVTVSAPRDTSQGISWENPVSLGHICTLPLLDDTGIDLRPLNITYVKLSRYPWGSMSLPRHEDPTIDAVYVEPMYKEMLNNSDFPHYPTANQYAINLYGRLGLVLAGFVHGSLALEHFTNGQASEHSRSQLHGCGES